MRIIGIDPGYGIMGWAIVDSPMEIIACGCIETEAGEPFEQRLLIIHRELSKIIVKYRPDAAAVERLFFARNSTTALDVAKAMGVILLTLKLHEIPHSEYTPIQVKRTLTGYGRATKEQIQHMIKRIFKMKTSDLKDDVTDAISVAACHCLMGKSFKLVHISESK
ncbi:MAG: crossover junction endodeoxyribonuclease RuvC [Spirochaetes bacterium]|nr:crossover junction endodeoxyribonuclease RuvC [Spirochaetota bacterium]